MADQRFEYYCDVVQTGAFAALHATLNDLGRKGWRLIHVVPHGRGSSGESNLFLVWERPFVVRERGGEEGSNG